MRVRLVQIRFDLERLDTHVREVGQAAHDLSDATALVLSRSEQLLPTLSALTLAALVASVLLSVITVFCRGLPKLARGGTLAIVLACVFLVFQEIQ